MNNKKRNLSDIDDVKVNKKMKFNLSIKDMIVGHSNQVDYAACIILEYLLKHTNVKLMGASTGRIADCYAIFNNNTSNTLGIQLKTVVNGTNYNFKHGTNSYSGMVIIFLDFKEVLLQKIINEQSITEDDLVDIRNISITYYDCLKKTETVTTVTCNQIKQFNIQPTNLGCKLIQYIRNPKIIKHSVEQWESMCLSRSHYTEQKNVYNLINKLDDLNIQTIMVQPCLEFDSFLVLNDNYYRIQFKSANKSGKVQMYNTKNTEKIKYYSDNSFDFIIIHHYNNPNRHLFIPITQLIKDNMIKIDETIDKPILNYRNYLEYEIDFTQSFCIYNIETIFNSHNNLLHIDKQIINKYALPGITYRQSRLFIKNLYKLLHKYSQDEILEYHSNIVELYENEYKINFDENQEYNFTYISFPEICPICLTTKFHMGRHIKTQHPEIMKNYNPRPTKETTKNKKKFQCSLCDTQFVTKDNATRHIRKMKNCINAKCISL